MRTGRAFLAVFAHLGDGHLGLVGEKNLPNLLPGQTREMLIYSTTFKQGKTSTVKLFDLSMTSEEINDYLNTY